MLEKQEEMRLKGRKVSMQDMVPIAHPEWKVSMKERWSCMHRDRAGVGLIQHCSLYMLRVEREGISHLVLAAISFQIQELNHMLIYKPSSKESK